MSHRLLRFFKNDALVDDLRWAKQMRKISKCLTTLDRNKYLIPKYSETIEPLAAYLIDHYVS